MATKYKVMSSKKSKRDLLEKYPPGKFNILAFLFGAFYFAYNGLWKWALVYFIATLFAYYIIGILIGPLIVALLTGFYFNKQYLESKGVYVKKVSR